MHCLLNSRPGEVLAVTMDYGTMDCGTMGNDIMARLQSASRMILEN
jgi:hypothetical protein